MKKAIVYFSILILAVVAVYLLLRIDFIQKDLNRINTEKNEVYSEFLGSNFSTEEVSEELIIYKHDNKTAIELYYYGGNPGYQGKVVDVLKLNGTFYIIALKPRSQSVNTALNLFNPLIFINEKVENVKVLYF